MLSLERDTPLYEFAWAAVRENTGFTCNGESVKVARLGGGKNWLYFSDCSPFLSTTILNLMIQTWTLLVLDAQTPDLSTPLVLCLSLVLVFVSLRPQLSSGLHTSSNKLFGLGFDCFQLQAKFRNVRNAVSNLPVICCCWIISGNKLVICFYFVSWRLERERKLINSW